MQDSNELRPRARILNPFRREAKSHSQVEWLLKVVPGVVRASSLPPKSTFDPKAPPQLESEGPPEIKSAGEK